MKNIQSWLSLLVVSTILSCGGTAARADDPNAKTGFGHTVSVRGQAMSGFVVSVDGKPLFTDRDDQLVEVHDLYQSSGHVYALIQEASGGNACPAMYQAISIDGQRPLATPVFGTCSDIPDVKADGGKLLVTMPEMTGKKTAYFSVEGGKLTKTTKAIAFGNEGPALAPATDLARLVAGKPPYEVVKIQAIVQAMRKAFGPKQAQVWIDYALSGPSGPFEDHGTFVVGQVCMAHDCGQNQSHVAFDHSGAAWLSIKTDGGVAIYGNPPNDVKMALNPRG